MRLIRISRPKPRSSKGGSIAISAYPTLIDVVRTKRRVTQQLEPVFDTLVQIPGAKGGIVDNFAEARGQAAGER
jgi:hypothetical protein